MDTEVGFRQVNALRAGGAACIDLLQQGAFEHFLSILTQFGKPFVTIPFIQNQGTKCVIKVLIPQQHGICPIFGELAKPYLIG